MASRKSIMRRIKSIKSTSQITKAMEVVSATKMRRSQEFALHARPYAKAALELLRNLLQRTPDHLLPPVLKPREIKRFSLLVITSDKGLAGAFNANVLRKATQWLSGQSIDIAKPYIITVGKKAKEYFQRRGESVAESFWGYGDYTTLAETAGIADTVIKGFLDRSWDEAYAVYTNFRTTLLQEAVIKKILPATPTGLQEAVQSILPERGRFAESQAPNSGLRAPAYQYEYKFEPSSAEILDALVPELIRMHIHHIILESNASEHSARMVAMKNASDNARELISKLAIEYNKLRQAGITRELAEITAGKEALEE